MPLLEKQPTILPLPILSLISPVLITFAKSLIDAFPSFDMEPSPKKAKPDLRNLTQEDAEDWIWIFVFGVFYPVFKYYKFCNMSFFFEVLYIDYP